MDSRIFEGVVVPIIVVGFRNASDVVACVNALASSSGAPPFRIFVCENGGPGAFDDLRAALVGPLGPCKETADPALLAVEPFVRMQQLRFRQRTEAIILAEAPDNLGFAGGVNSWLRYFQHFDALSGVWILNPDTMPEPGALAELVRYAAVRRKGLVGSRIMFPDRANIVASRGLRWRKLAATTEGVDMFAPGSPAPDPDDVEARIDSPSGVSLFATRGCLEQIGVLDEKYFLYYEDFDWGVRAKRACGIGYAHNSIVPHIGGSTTGMVSRRAARSRLAVYLGHRNRLIFVSAHHRRWYYWTILVTALRSLEYLAAGSPENFIAAVRGLIAGIEGETGRPIVYR